MGFIALSLFFLLARYYAYWCRHNKVTKMDFWETACNVCIKFSHKQVHFYPQMTKSRTRVLTYGISSDGWPCIFNWRFNTSDVLLCIVGSQYDVMIIAIKWSKIIKYMDMYLMILEYLILPGLLWHVVQTWSYFALSFLSTDTAREFWQVIHSCSYVSWVQVNSTWQLSCYV